MTKIKAALLATLSLIAGPAIVFVFFFFVEAYLPGEAGSVIFLTISTLIGGSFWVELYKLFRDW